jgi:hypothetical protein
VNLEQNLLQGEVSEVLPLGTQFTKEPQNSEMKLNNILMKYFKNKIHVIHHEHNIKI